MKEKTRKCRLTTGFQHEVLVLRPQVIDTLGGAGGVSNRNVLEVKPFLVELWREDRDGTHRHVVQR